jgi:hypothetical protein
VGSGGVAHTLAGQHARGSTTTSAAEPLNQMAAQTIRPQARTVAKDRDFRCVVVDYDALRGLDPTNPRLF